MNPMLRQRSIPGCEGEELFSKWSREHAHVDGLVKVAEWSLLFIAFTGELTCRYLVYLHLYIWVILYCNGEEFLLFTKLGKFCLIGPPLHLISIPGPFYSGFSFNLPAVL
jgi:hypothetical protein